jgi:hypothetical protein
MDMEIKLEHLLFPHRLAEDGWEFVQAHGLDRMTLAELQMRVIDLDDGKPENLGLVRLKHRCQHLTDQGQCDIYATRPKICQEFDCKTRSDCRFDGFPGFIPVHMVLEVKDAVRPDPRS